jgi:hypothetical protein
LEKLKETLKGVEVDLDDKNKEIVDLNFKLIEKTKEIETQA